jgi:hypothetical protein
MSLIMKEKEMGIARDTSPFITKASMSPIHSPITKACTSFFITKAGSSLIPIIERDACYKGTSRFLIPLIKLVPS